MKKIKFTRDVFESGRRLFAAGAEVEPRPDLAKHVRRGLAIEINVAEKPSRAATETESSADRTRK